VAKNRIGGKKGGEERRGGRGRRVEGGHDCWAGSIGEVNEHMWLKQILGWEQGHITN
jgi:hypothetical protein